ncbi:hypothetical protein [Paenibacillus sp. URB8-2]|uniref:hypothetical protein n=1 Tax=Paenibacillus sp. URB8-2 TaxID=2741301 RepID=UPI001E45DF6B|nr:hypothetical protein [Paenibacillus sp. URB8-2]
MMKYLNVGCPIGGSNEHIAFVQARERLMLSLECRRFLRKAFPFLPSVLSLGLPKPKAGMMTFHNAKRFCNGTSAEVRRKLIKALIKLGVERIRIVPGTVSQPFYRRHNRLGG